MRCGLYKRRIVERAGADKDQMRSFFRGACYMGTALRTEFPMHVISAFGERRVIGEISRKSYVIALKTDIDRALPRADVLAKPAPADPGD